jgi:hypothetical protein
VRKEAEKMELKSQEQSEIKEYLSEYETLIGDQRTGRTFQSVIEGIIGSESLKAVRIGRFSPSAGVE